MVNYLGENNKQAYLTASNGARCGLASIQVFEEQFGLAFGAPEGTEGYIPTWPGNPDIELDK